jgi:DNA-directed RNA polymerase specialized sigma24 family protein
VGGTGAAPDVGVERAELAHAVRASLGALPAPQRQAIELAFLGGPDARRGGRRARPAALAR